jgi:methionyl-tRNA formyltransferase
MRLAFMGAPDFAVPALEALLAAGHDIACVYTQPPRPAGRGKQPRPTPVQRRAEAAGLPVRTPLTLRDADEQAAFAALSLDAAIVVAYGLILPKPILEAPRYGCLNLHASLLPRWRGAAPIQRAIMAGDPETGVCIMQMAEGLDTGPVLARAATPIGPQETAGGLHDRLAALGAPLLAETVARLDARPAAEPQDDALATYADKIDKAEARIDWTASAEDLDRRVRGLSPFPGAWTELNGVRIKILMAEPTGATGEPGAVLDNTLLIGCGEGALRLLRLQRAGKAAADAAEFLRGFPIEVGARAL